MDAICGVIGIIAVVAAAFLLFYLLRTTPRNEGDLHGGGLQGADSAFGYPPLDLEEDPKVPPSESFRSQTETTL